MTPTFTNSTLEYFKEAQFEARKEIYNTALDNMTECLEHGLSIPDASTLSISHLPCIRLPPFDGTYADWENFHDRFTGLIIKNKNISDFARMHFFAFSLKGRAREFENKRRLFASHLSALLGLSAVARESAPDLRATHGTIF
ncbi:hypothetical protein ACFW04_011391 [Cataglyphis niger]